MSYAPSTDRTDPTKGAYNGFSLADRFAAGAWAKQHGLPARPERPCIVCGQTEGLLYWHQEDYRTPVDAFPMCAWCHWALHSRLKPSQRALWGRWLHALDSGRRPPPCPFGARWQTFAARYMRKPSIEWDWSDGHDRIRPTFALMLPAHATNRVQFPFRLIEGDPWMPGQFNSVEATGELQVYRNFVPALV